MGAKGRMPNTHLTNVVMALHVEDDDIFIIIKRVEINVERTI